VSRARLLAVDDASAVRATLQGWLQGAGHEVVAEAGTGQEALAAFEAERPDLVLLGWVLPGMTGIHVLRRFAAAAPGLPVVVCSALDGERFITQALEAGAVDYLTKPLQREVLLLAVDKALVGSAG